MNGDVDRQLLDHIYAGAWDPAALEEALRTLAHTCRSCSAGVFRLRDGALVWNQAWNMPDDFMDDFVANAAPRDPRVRFGLSRAPMTLMRDDDRGMRRAMCANGIDAFTRNYDLPYTLSMVLDQPAPGDALALYVSRNASEGRPDTAQLDAFTRYAPHFARAMGLRRRVHGDLLTDAAALTAAGVPAMGLLALDPHGRVRWLDGGARRLLDACEGLALRGSRLRFEHRRDRHFFEHMRPTAVSPAVPAAPVADELRIAQRQPPGVLSLRQMPHPHAPQAARAPVLVLLQHASLAPAPSRAAMPAPTPRQGQVLMLMAQGLMSKQIGSCLGITENTVRNHIQQLLRLFEVSTRTACVARARACGLLDPTGSRVPEWADARHQR